jgi:hypothetical protein
VQVCVCLRVMEPGIAAPEPRDALSVGSSRPALASGELQPRLRRRADHERRHSRIRVRGVVEDEDGPRAA